MIIIIALTFIVLLTIPLIGALIYYKKRDGIILDINQDKTRDPRYFEIICRTNREKLT